LKRRHTQTACRWLYTERKNNLGGRNNRLFTKHVKERGLATWVLQLGSCNLGFAIRVLQPRPCNPAFAIRALQPAPQKGNFLRLASHISIGKVLRSMACCHTRQTWSATFFMDTPKASRSS